jgi:hypothetical protein
MKYLMTVILLLWSVSVVFADQRVVIRWLVGNCKDSFKVYRAMAIVGWVEVAEVVEPELEIVVPNQVVRWKVSGICKSGVRKGEWWMGQGVWTGNNVFVDKKR